MEYLGHVIDGTGIHPTKDKIQAIKEAPVPKDITQLRAFVTIMVTGGNTHGSLVQADGKESQVVKTEECHNAYLKGNEMLICEAVLAHYDSTKAMKLTCNCNAFAYGLGAVLSHTLDDGEHPVASIYLPHVDKSRKKLQSDQKGGTGTSLWDKKFHKYLYGRCFTLITDHKPLLSMLSTKAEVPSVAAAHMQRWAIFLSAYNITLNSRAPRCRQPITVTNGRQGRL